ncbi:hypothetical protein D3C78_1131880 [compost metagenome]
MKIRHPLLSLRIKAGKNLLRISNRLIIDMANQLLSCPPCLLLGLTHNDMKTNAKANAAPLLLCQSSHLGNFLSNLLRRHSPG